MLRVKAVVSGMSVSLKGNASARKTWKMLERHVQVCLEISTIIIILFKVGFTLITFLSLISKYRIYSINRPGSLLNFWTLRVGAYMRWALLTFSPFSVSLVCLSCNETVNGNNKMRRCNKANFCKINLGWEVERGWALI